MAARELTARIQRRAMRAGARVPSEVAGQLGVYLELLAKWNRRLNLTALSLDPIADSAIDRLVVEPAVAARWIRPSDAILIDIGTGGGSPALPLKLMAPHVSLTMVEVKVRKTAFLREAVRTLGIDGADVVTARYEELLARPDLCGSVDACSLRAVRADDGLWRVVQGLSAPGARVLWFAESQVASPLQLAAIHTERFPHGPMLTVLEEVRPSSPRAGRGRP